MKATAVIFTLLLLAGTLLPGCSKADILSGYDSVIRLAGELGLTGDKNLQGERQFGTDHYTGTYDVDYVNFTGTEHIFGGTALERKEGETVEITCRIEGSAGEARLICNYGSDGPMILLDGAGEYAETIYLTPGSNYFTVQCEDFTGSVELKIE